MKHRRTRDNALAALAVAFVAAVSIAGVIFAAAKLKIALFILGM